LLGFSQKGTGWAGASSFLWISLAVIHWITLAVIHWITIARKLTLPNFEANQPGFDGDGKATGDHAGKVETSLLWALEPTCVDVSRFPAQDAPGPHFAMGPTARQADRRVGERMVADEVAWLGQKAADLLEDYAAQGGSDRTPLSFMDIERIWAADVLPRLPEFQTMQYLERTPPPEDSRWRLNYTLPQQLP
jgi:creatinine amidohydrolase